MKVMFFILPILAAFVSCEKETASEINLLPGKWNLVKTELYENDFLKGTSVTEPEQTSYYFYDETRGDQAGTMYIEEEGEQQTYSYSYDEWAGVIALDGTMVFTVDAISPGQLTLSRSYDGYRSTYSFIREN